MKKKKRYKRYPASVRESAVERMRLGVNVSELAAELEVNRTTLYFWKDQMEERGPKQQSAPKGAEPVDERDYRIRELESKVSGLEGELGRAALETRFFRGALRRIEESCQKNENTGATASSPRSATGRTRKAKSV
jgi:transposase-like protein